MGLLNKLFRTKTKKTGANSKIIQRQYASGKVTNTYQYKSRGKTTSVNMSSGRRRTRKV